MPELPEIEQVRKTLKPHIVNKMVKHVDIRLPRMIKHPAPENFADILVGQSVRELKRRGKYLIIEFNTNLRLVIHLRMTGALVAADSDVAEPPYAKVRFDLTGDKTLWFCDIRTFGTMHLIVNDDISLPGLEKLGPEPGSSEFSAEYLEKIVKNRTGAIKGVLLNQEAVAGLGNIYVDEALAHAGILPQKPARSLSRKELKELVASVNKVIRQGIKNHGTTFRNYVDGNGTQGTNQHHLLVYGRKGQPCKKCGRQLIGTKVAGRGTTYCANCQR